MLLSTPVTNTKLEHMLSCLLRVKTDRRNILANERLDHNLRISEEGVLPLIIIPMMTSQNDIMRK